MSNLPSTGFVRLAQIIGDPKANPPVPAIIPVCASHWWNGCRSGKFPKPIRMGRRCTLWRVEDIRALVDRISSSGI